MNSENKIIWVEILRRRSTLLFTYLARMGEADRINVRNSLGLDFSIPNAKEVDTRIIIDVVSSNKFRQLILDKVKGDEKYFSDYSKRCLASCKELLSFARDYSQKDFKSLSNQKLKNIFQEYINLTLQLVPFLNSFVLLSDILSNLLKEDPALKDINIEGVIFPTDINFVSKEVENTLKIAAKIMGKPSLKNAILEADKNSIIGILHREESISHLINEHIKQYGWITTIAYVGNFMTLDNLFPRLKNLLSDNPLFKLKDAQKRRSRAKQRFDKLLKNSKLSIRSKKLLKIASQYLYLKFYRIDVFWITHYLFHGFYLEAARRFGITYKDTLYLTHEEILKSLEKEKLLVSKSEIKNRRKKFALVVINGKPKIYSGNKVFKLIGKEKIKKEEAREKILKGVVACQGKARGKVKIVMNIKSMNKFRKGDILVTNMTTPDLMLAIEKSVAIVTDEGGMLCHAAIVSRELGIPCLIGTGSATKLFKDGDFVEVDAVKGSVRKI